MQRARAAGAQPASSLQARLVAARGTPGGAKHCWRARRAARACMRVWPARACLPLGVCGYVCVCVCVRARMNEPSSAAVPCCSKRVCTRGGAQAADLLPPSAAALAAPSLLLWCALRCVREDVLTVAAPPDSACARAIGSRVRVCVGWVHAFVPTRQHASGPRGTTVAAAARRHVSRCI
jgi:hypothetical protein